MRIYSELLEKTILMRCSFTESGREGLLYRLAAAAAPKSTYRRKGIIVMNDAQKKLSFQQVNIILRILAIVYLLLQVIFLRLEDRSCLLAVIPIMIVAVRKRNDTVNWVMSVIASAGIGFYFISWYLPRPLFFESNGDLNFFGQLHIVVWILSLFTGIYVLPLRDLMKASEENGGNGMMIRIIGFFLLILSSIPAILTLGFILWMAVTNYYP
jgi:hypothetical protein